MHPIYNGIGNPAAIFEKMGRHDIPANAQIAHNDVVRAIMGMGLSWTTRIEALTNVSVLFRLGAKYIVDATECLIMARYVDADGALAAIHRSIRSILAKSRSENSVVIPVVIGLMNARTLCVHELQQNEKFLEMLPTTVGSLLALWVNNTWDEVVVRNAKDQEKFDYISGEFSRSLSFYLGGSDEPTEETITAAQEIMRSMHETLHATVPRPAQWLVKEVTHRVFAMRSMRERVRLLAEGQEKDDSVAA